MLLRPVLDRFDLTVVTTDPGLAEREGIGSALIISECNRDQPVKMLRCLFEAWGAVRSARPEVVITTGAMPGLLVLVVARLGGAKTIWIDSVANAEEPSFSGKFARPFASLWLTQWAHLAGAKGRKFAGSLL